MMNKFVNETEDWYPDFNYSQSMFGSTQYSTLTNVSEQVPPSKKKKVKRKKIQPVTHSVVIDEIGDDDDILKRSNELVPFNQYSISFSSDDEDNNIDRFENLYSHKSNTLFIKELESEEETFSDQYEESVLTFDMERFSDIVFNIPEREECETCGYDIFQICTTNIEVFKKFIKTDTLYQRFLFNFVNNVVKSLVNFS